MTPAVTIENVSKSFGRQTVLSDISLTLSTGSITGIMGRNGSGKTVLMKILLGFLKPDSGRVFVFGKEIGKDCDFAPDTGMIIETPGFIDTESGVHNLRYLKKLGRKEKTGLSPEEAMRLTGLDPSDRKPVSKYSLGMRQRLGIAQAVMDDPSLLVLDEPMNGLDNAGVEQMRQLLSDLKAQGKTILLVSHNPLDLEILCDSIYEMNGGKLTPSSL